MALPPTQRGNNEGQAPADNAKGNGAGYAAAFCGRARGNGFVCFDWHGPTVRQGGEDAYKGKFRGYALDFSLVQYLDAD